MRVLQVIPWLATRAGGPAVTVVESSLALQAAGTEVTIFTTDVGRLWSAGTRERVTPADVPQGAERLDVRYFRARQPYRLTFSPGLYGALRREVGRYDVVHIHSLFQWPQYAAFSQARRSDVPWVVAPCGALDPWLRDRSRRVKRLTDAVWQRRMLDEAALLHYKTEEEARLVADLELRAPYRVVPNGIDWQRFQALPPGDGFRAEQLGGHGGPVVLSLGRLSHKKGLDVLIRAFAAVAPGDAMLVIAGPDDEGLSPGLAALAASCGVAERVKFTGMLRGDDRLAALAAADVWALPSHTENFGLAVVEALAAGCPVITTRAVNVAPDMEAAGAAEITEPEPEAFGEQLAGLLADKERARAIGERGREFARRYDWSAVAPQLVEMYETAVARR